MSQLLFAYNWDIAEIQQIEMVLFLLPKSNY